MRVYNTLTRKKEEFSPIREGRVTIYCCGPTVYNLIHIGNARPIIVFDALRRYLKYRGLDVLFAQNFTDIDDKVINRANEEGVSYDVIAARYIEEYYRDARGLGVLDADIAPKATGNIDAIIGIVEKLIEKGHAYTLGGDVYFRTGSFAEYGKLSGQSLEELVSGARVDKNEKKENPLDFALWKAAKEGEPFWESPWGKGRPGWHIECSAMSSRFLGDTIDMHCGGQDLIFPHHENEIAQSECASGKPFVRYWLHNGFINIDNQKMSKSLGNFFTVRDIAGEAGYEPIRFFMLAAHYRSPLNFTRESIEQSKAALTRLYTAQQNLEFLAESGNIGPMSESERGLCDRFSEYRGRFCEALDDDFNTADAIGVLFELVRDMNTGSKDATRVFAQAALDMMLELCGVLGLLYNLGSQSLDEEIEAMIEQRRKAREEKNFREADRIRDELKEKGILLEDTPQGVKWRRAQS